MRDDWLGGNLCLFLGEVPGHNLHVIESSVGKEFPSPTFNSRAL